MANLKMKNYMKDIVEDVMPSVMKALPDVCKCERCEMDIMAYALNLLPTKYVVTHTGQLYSKLHLMHMQFDADVVTAITRGAKMVAKSPRHEQ